MTDDDKINSLKQACDRYLVDQKAKIYQEMAAALLEKTAELQDSLDITAEAFRVCIDRKMAAAKLIEPEEARQTRIQQLEEDLEEFAILQSNLTDRF
jgi:hypothetical protein